MERGVEELKMVLFFFVASVSIFSSKEKERDREEEKEESYLPFLSSLLSSVHSPSLFFLFLSFSFLSFHFLSFVKRSKERE